MMTTSAFEILGPIMVGPSSSHTAGALRIAAVARSLAPCHVARARFTLHNSFSRTYRGHGTDRALVAGMLGLAPDDTRVRDSFSMAVEQGMDFSFVEAGDDADLHPNTVTIGMLCDDGTSIEVRGESLGGGRVRISALNGVEVEITGDYPTLFVSHMDRPGVLAALTGAMARADANIATVHTYRTSRGGNAYTVFECDQRVDAELLSQIRGIDNVLEASVVEVPGASGVAPDTRLAMGFDTGAALLALCASHSLSIGSVMRERELELAGKGAEKCVDDAMARVIEVMREETASTIEMPERSLGGFLYGQAKQVADASERLAPTLMGPTLTDAVARAMAVLERSATMGVIVAAPTAGSAGVVPAAVLSVARAMGASDDEIARALWCASAVGAVVARNASVAGAEGGCQAEVGTASAMAAAGLVELLGGTPRQALEASSIAITNLLGLVCDPVRGIVEYPCQDRNAIGVADAFSAAQLALSGIGGPVPFDEVVAAMDSVGRSIPVALRETAMGGLAAAPSCTGCAGGCTTA